MTIEPFDPTKFYPQPTIIKYKNQSRFCWPDIVKYRFRIGHVKVTSLLPPDDDEIVFYFIIYDYNKFRDLMRSNLLTSEMHTGRKSVAIDNRKAPGA